MRRDILEGIKDERAFKILIEMLSHPDSNIRKHAAGCLGRYGDKRAFEPVVKVSAEDPDDPDVKEAVKALAKDPETYRKTLAAYGIVGRERVRKLGEAARRLFTELEYADREWFEGDEAEKFNAVVREYRFMEGIGTLLSKISQLATDESVVSDRTYKRLEAIGWRMRWDNIRLERSFGDVIKASEGYFPGPSMGKSEKSYRGLTKGSWTDPQPGLDALRDGIHDWLKARGFKVHKRGRILWARKRRAGKECLVRLEKEEGKRVYGKVSIEPCGKGWTANEAEAFKATLWKIVDRLASEATKEMKPDNQRSVS